MVEAPSQTMFDELADTYDRLIDWPRRLAAEGPYFRALFEAHQVRSVQDVGCGTGHHAAMFHSWGLDVEGCDVSEAMLARCRERFGERPGLRWTRRSFASPADRGALFDAVVCIGNTLALAGDAGEAAEAVRGMVNRVRPGGVGVIQVVNLPSVAEGAIRWQKVRRFDGDAGATVVLKGVHRVGERGYVDIMELGLPESGVKWRARTASFLGLARAALCEMIRAWGGEVRHVFGSYGGEAFDERASVDLIVEWWRGRCG